MYICKDVQMSVLISTDFTKKFKRTQDKAKIQVEKTEIDLRYIQDLLQLNLM